MTYEPLTAYGSLAVDFIARATRMDGKFKINPREDLRMARWLIDRELEQLGEANDE